jgi:signal transduction histidine kinase
MSAKDGLPPPEPFDDAGAEAAKTPLPDLEAIGSPALVADLQARVMALNEAARDWLCVSAAASEPLRLGALVVSDLPYPWPSILAADHAVTVGGRRTTGGSQAQQALVTSIPFGELRLVIFSQERDTTGTVTDGHPETARFAQLLDAVSHELRNPLTPILGMSEMLLDGDVGDLTPEQERLVKHVYRGAARLTAALDALLDLSRLCARKRSVEPVPVHVRFCLERVTDLLRARPQIDTCDVRVDVSDKGLQCVTDPRLLERTLLELVEYSLRRGAGGMYWLRAEATQGGLVVSLVDSANGQSRMGAAVEMGNNGHVLGSSVAHEMARILGLRIGGPSGGQPECVFQVFVPSQI